MASSKARALLEQGLSELGLATDSVSDLMSYLELMQKWNKAINLTAITDINDMVVKHLLDSLAIIPALDELIKDKSSATVLDVGSGGGLPGIPLAIMRPTLSITLCESIAKKCAFLNRVKTTLNHANVTVVNERVEALTSPTCFDIITARAVATIDKLHELTEHLGDENTVWCLMKSHDEAMDSQLSTNKKVEKLPIHVPFLNAPRHLVMIKQR